MQPSSRPVVFIQRLFLVLVLPVFFPVLSGCGGSRGPELATVTGVITLDGEPVQQAVIRFLPDNSQGTSGPIAAGSVDSSGRYTLASPGGRSGAVLGHHLVTVICDDLPVREVSEGVFENIEKSCHVPSRYASEQSSGLTAEVTNGKNEINFELRTIQ